MDFLFIKVLLAANKSNGEDSVWITILVLVILAAGAGIWTSFKKKAAKPNGRQGQADYSDAQGETGKGLYKINLQKKHEARKKFYRELLTAPQEPIPVTEISQSRETIKPRRAAREKIDSNSGIEIIETVYLEPLTK